MKELISTRSKSKHVEDIANSIFASWNLFPAATVDFIPFFDNLKSLIQDRIILSFFDISNNEQKLLFHTFQDPYFENELDASILKFVTEHPACGINLNDNISLFAMKFSFPNSNSKLILDVVELEDSDYKQLKDLIETITQEYELLIPVISNFVKTANANLSHKYRQPVSRLVDATFDLNKASFLDEIRDLIEECVVDVANSLLLQADLGNNNFMPNLFAVVAYPSESKRCDVFNYSAQILLTKTQQAAINKWANSEDYSTILETPLSNSARSISDTSFCTGFVEYSGIAGKEMDSAVSDGDQKRQVQEEKLYATLTNTQSIGERVVNFIPIFLNGCPWIVFYSLSKKEENSNKAWDHNYFIYRDLIYKVGNSIRIKAKNRYFEIISDIIENSYNGSFYVDTYLQKVNIQIKQLSCFFPFPIPVLQLKQGIPADSFFLNKIEFKTSEKLINVFWKPYLEYDNLNDAIILKEACEILRDFVNHKEMENKKRELSVASYGSAHFYGNWLGIMNSAVTRITSDIEDLPQNCKSNESFNRMEESLLDLHDANNGMRGVTVIVDLLAKRHALVDGQLPQGILVSDSRFYTIDEIELNKIINEKLSLLKIAPSDNLINSIIIPPFLNESKKPAVQFYENIVLEILTNYQKRNNGSLAIKEVHSNGSLVGISFENPCLYPSGTETMNRPLEIDRREFKGAIYYCHLFLKEFGLGQILYKRTCNVSGGLFEFQVILNNMEYVKKTKNTANR